MNRAELRRLIQGPIAAVSTAFDDDWKTRGAFTQTLDVTVQRGSTSNAEYEIALREDFADNVIAGIDRLHPARDAHPVVASRHLELHQGGRQAVTPRRRMGVVRGTARAVVGVGLIAAATGLALVAVMPRAALEMAGGRNRVVSSWISATRAASALSSRSARLESRFWVRVR